MIAIVHSAESRPLPKGVESWLVTLGLTVERLNDPDTVLATAMRGIKYVGRPA